MVNNYDPRGSCCDVSLPSSANGELLCSCALWWVNSDSRLGHHVLIYLFLFEKEQITNIIMPISSSNASTAKAVTNKVITFKVATTKAATIPLHH